MGFASQYDVWVNPLARDWQVFVPMFLMWFIIQYLAEHHVLKRIVPGWSSFSKADKEDLIIRACSIVNSALMSGGAVIFLYNLHALGWNLSDDLYLVISTPGWSFFRTAIVAYFAWDLVVCFVYKWSLAWKVHAVCSLLGTYTMLYPFSDTYSGFYTGCFEISNAFLHVSCSLRLICQNVSGKKGFSQKTVDSLGSIAAVCEYGFALLYTVIRVIGGTYVTGTWMQHAVRYVMTDFKSRGMKNRRVMVHDELALSVSFVTIAVVQLLQYVWFVAIVKKGLGIEEAEEKPKKN